jgi:hypothetical protein
MSYIIKTGVSSAIKLEIYNGNYSLTSGWIDKEGNFKLNWSTVETYNKETRVKTDKKMPIKISLWSKDRSIEILRELLTELGDSEGAPF